MGRPRVFTPSFEHGRFIVALLTFLPVCVRLPTCPLLILTAFMSHLTAVWPQFFLEGCLNFWETSFSSILPGFKAWGALSYFKASLVPLRKRSPFTKGPYTTFPLGRSLVFYKKPPGGFKIRGSPVH